MTPAHDTRILGYLLSLSEEEFKFALDSMTESDAYSILEVLAVAKDDIFDLVMEREGMSESKEFLSKFTIKVK